MKLSSVVSSSSSSDEDVIIEPRLCVTNRDDDGTCAIYSQHCPIEITPKYFQNSFVIYNRKLVLTVEMNPMFAWRLIHTIENTKECACDDVRIRTRASYDMNTNPIVYVIPHMNPCYLKLLDAFNVMYADRYNTPEKMKQMLLALSKVILHKYM